LIKLLKKVIKYLPAGLQKWIVERYWLSQVKAHYHFRFNGFDRAELKQFERYVNMHLPSGDKQAALMKASVDEYIALKPLLNQLFPGVKPPIKIMDYGCGLGRSSIFMRQMFKWQEAIFYLVDGHGECTAGLRPSQRGYHVDVAGLVDSFYTDFKLIRKFLLANDLSNFVMIDLAGGKEALNRIKDLDLFYSFHSLGYHYDISAMFELYGLNELVRPGGVYIFGIRRQGDPLRRSLGYEDLLSKYGLELIAEVAGAWMQDFVLLCKKGQSVGWEAGRQ